MFCSNCGQRLTDDAKHCPNCGVLIRRDTEDPTSGFGAYSRDPENAQPSGEASRPGAGEQPYSAGYGQPAGAPRDPYGNAYGYAAPAPTKADGYALTGVILAIVSGVCSCVPFIGLPCAVLGIIFSIKGLKSETRHTMAVVGLILSVVFTACNLMTGFSVAMALARADTWTDILESAGYDFGFDFNIH